MPMRWWLGALILGTGCDKGVDTGLDSGIVEEGTPQLSLSVSSLDFGDVEPNVVHSDTLTLENIGDETLNISSITTGAPAPFTLSDSRLAVQAGGAVLLTVYFYPTEFSSFTDTITLVTDDPTQPSVTLDVTGQVVGDIDEDGHLSYSAGGEDCDDEDPDIYPGAPEAWYDGIDSDCDGADDYDQDGDGYQSDLYNDNPNAGGGDCNDVWPDIYPGAKDEWYDGIDSDCAGDNDWDADGDGFASAYYDRGGDCDDSSATRYPSAPELLNGILDDCDGEGIDQNVSPSSADFQYLPTDSFQALGTALTAGDLDEDGVSDLIVGMPGFSDGTGGIGVYLSIYGWPSSGSSAVSDSTDFFYADDEEGFGSSLVLLRDFDGDGVSDLAVGSPDASSQQGMIRVFSGSDVASGADIDDAIATINPANGHYFVGRSLAGPVDLDGDGVDELIFEYRPTLSATQLSYIGLHYGGGDSNVDADSVDARFSTGSSGSIERDFPTYQALSAGADLNGDGYEDWVYCDPMGDNLPSVENNTVTSTSNDGSIWVLWGETSRHSYPSLTSMDSAAQLVATGANTREWAGIVCGAMPDRDGDGDGELYYWVNETGDVVVIDGTSSLDEGTYTEDDASALIGFSTSWDATQVGGIGDWTGDGIQEWGFAFDGGTVSTEGAVFLFDPSGLDMDSNYTDSSLASLVGVEEESSALLGWSFPLGGNDYNGDGQPDLALGDPGWEEDLDGDKVAEFDAGAIYLFLNGY